MRRAILRAMDRPPSPAAPWQDGGKTNGTAVFALVSSLSGYVCFLGVGGALGVILGLIARSEISRAEGREGGRGLATAAIALGIFNVCLTVIGAAAGIAYLARPAGAPPSAARATPTATAPAWRPPSTPPRAAKPSSNAAPPGRASR